MPMPAQRAEAHEHRRTDGLAVMRIGLGLVVEGVVMLGAASAVVAMLIRDGVCVRAHHGRVVTMVVAGRVGMDPRQEDRGDQHHDAQAQEHAARAGGRQQHPGDRRAQEQPGALDGARDDVRRRQLRRVGRELREQRRLGGP